MAATIQINGVSQRFASVPYGVAVSLLNAAPTGTSQKWEVLSYPLDADEGPPDFATNWVGWTAVGDGRYQITQPSSPFAAVTFKPDITGSYLIRLTSTEAAGTFVQTAVIQVKEIFSGETVPAPGETIETGTFRGTAKAVNGMFKRMARWHQGCVRVANISGGSLARGKVVKLTATRDGHIVSPNVNPGGTAAAKTEKLPTVTLADNTAAGAAAFEFAILEETLANNSMGWARVYGLFLGGADVDYTGFTAGAKVWFNNLGVQVSAEPGSGAKIELGTLLENGADGSLWVHIRPKFLDTTALSGVTGGQTWTGGTAAGDDLLIRATSHGSPSGAIIRIGGGAGGLTIDQANGRVSIGGDPGSWPLIIQNYTQAFAQFLSNANSGFAGIDFRTNGNTIIGSLNVFGSAYGSNYFGFTANNTMGLLANGPVEVGSTSPHRLILGTNDVCRLFLHSGASVASGGLAVWDAVDWFGSTLVLTGNSLCDQASGVNQHVFRAPTLSAGSPLTVRHAATVTILGAPSGAGAGPATITNALPFWVQSGVSVFGANPGNAPAGATLFARAAGTAAGSYESIAAFAKSNTNGTGLLIQSKGGAVRLVADSREGGGIAQDLVLGAFSSGGVYVDVLTIGAGFFSASNAVSSVGSATGAWSFENTHVDAVSSMRVRHTIGTRDVLLESYGSNAGGTIGGQTRNSASALRSNGSTLLAIGTTDNKPLYFFTQDVARMSIDGAGTVKIGDVAFDTQYSLDIRDNARGNMKWGNTTISGFLSKHGSGGGGVDIGSETNHSFSLYSNNTLSFTIDTSQNIAIAEGKNIIPGTTTGTKICTATGQKLSFWNATPVVQQVLATGAGATVDNVITLLQTLGLCKQA